MNRTWLLAGGFIVACLFGLVWNKVIMPKLVNWLRPTWNKLEQLLARKFGTPSGE